MEDELNVESWTARTVSPRLGIGLAEGTVTLFKKK